MNSEKAKTAWKKWGSAAFGVLFIGLLYILFNRLASFDYEGILRTIKGYESKSIALAVFFTFLSYSLMGGYDWLGQRYIGKSVGWKKSLLVAFYSYVLSLNVGLSLVSSSAVRYKMYQNWGYKGGDIAKLIVFASISFWLGLAVLAGICLCATEVSFNGAYPIPDYLVKPVGALLVLAGIVYVFLCKFGSGEVKIKGSSFSLPNWKVGVGQIGITILDTLAAASALFVLIPDPSLGFAAFASIFGIAFFGGLLSNTPGGIGVFETVFILFLPTSIDSNELMAALLVYRAIYFILPLVVACVMFATLEGRAIAGKVGPRLSRAQGWLSSIAPRVLSALIFVGGLTLLLTGSLPSPPEHARWLEHLFPLTVVELSHFVGSLVGVSLLFLAYGIKKRLDSAYYVTMLALAVSAPASLIRGDGFAAFSLLVSMAAILAPCRRYFYRKSSLVHMEMSGRSIATIVMATTCAFYIGFYVYHDSHYDDQLWWMFEFDEDKSRFLRTFLVVALLGGAFAAYKLLHAAKPRAGYSYGECKDKVGKVLETSTVAASNLALMGDKRFFFSGDDSAFIMFRIQGRTWVAMGDPVGNHSVFKELIGEFKELCSEFAGIPVFYQTSKDHLHKYVDVGLRPVKVGEVARVRLEDFSLEGSRRQSMRSRLKRVAKKGCEFEVLSQGDALLEMKELRAISDEWLEKKGASEKGFSLGYFDERYLSHFRIAVARMNGKIVAFTNIWETFGRNELSIDLMRYSSEAPPSVMEFLFVELMKWSKEEGFEWFDLRIAPLSGISKGNSVPMFNKLLDLVFNNGESFYKFRGLRSYKERFDPVWEPMYVASQGGWKLPLVTADVTRIVSSRPKIESN